MIGIVIGVVVIVVIAGVILHGKMQSDSPRKEQTEGQTKEQTREQVKDQAKEKADMQPAKAKAAAGMQTGKTGRESTGPKEASEAVPAAAGKADEKAAGQAEIREAAGEKDDPAQAKELEKRQRAQAAAEERNLKGELYRFLNHGLQVLYTAYNDDAWEQTEVLGTVSPALYEKMDEMTDKLPTVTKKLLTEYLACMEFGQTAENAAEDAGTKEAKEEEALCAFVKDRDRLKEAFLKCMMPFYPFYYEELKKGGLRHTALLAPDTLRLYHQLTGKNFRPGYRNRYKSGVRAFEWEKNRYRIFAENGDLLCDAVFEDGKIVSGTGRSTERDPKNPDWNIVREGEWKEGVFTERTVRYEYRKPVNI